MGQSTNGILFWGFPLPEDATMAWDKDIFNREWETYYTMTVRDIAKESLSKEDFWRETWKAESISKCQIASHCSCDYSMYYVCISDTEVTAHRGSPERIRSHHLEVKTEWTYILKQFCEQMKIEYQQPDWYLVSMWC